MENRRLLLRAVGILLLLTSAMPIVAIYSIGRQSRDATRRILDQHGVANAAERAADMHFEIGWGWSLLPALLALIASANMLLGAAVLVLASRQPRISK